MIISDLLDEKARGIFTDDKVLKCGLVALDAKNGRILFDTEKNKKSIELCKCRNCKGGRLI